MGVGEGRSADFNDSRGLFSIAFTYHILVKHSFKKLVRFAC